MGSRRSDSGHMGRQRIDDLWFQYENRSYLIVGWFNMNPERINDDDEELAVSNLLKHKVYLLADGNGNVYKQYWSRGTRGIVQETVESLKRRVDNENRDRYYLWLGRE